MPEPLGNLSIVLHGHLPYVLHHGTYPHGEHWLFEAAAETYLPLLDFIGEAALGGVRCGLTIGLTPVLLEQLAHPRFKRGFLAYLSERAARGLSDQAEFEAEGRGHLAYLAGRWNEWYTAKLHHFERIGQDLPAEFSRHHRDGQIEVLTSNATHAYMPLLLNDQMLAAQMSAGTATSERILGFRPRGMWLPECAYRPHWPNWTPSVLYDDARDRPGVETFIARAGVDHFFVESHLIKQATPLGVVDHGGFSAVGEDPSGWDQRRGWRNPLEPVGVASEPRPPEVYALGRHPQVSEQVWSGDLGYPGAGEYMEFHRKHGERGLRYHKVTHRKTALSDKELYYPDDTAGKLHEHAHHFLDTVKGVLAEHRDRTGRRGTVVASFDAELFGHWWFEGPRFLRDVDLRGPHRRAPQPGDEPAGDRRPAAGQGRAAAGGELGRERRPYSLDERAGAVDLGGRVPGRGDVPAAAARACRGRATRASATCSRRPGGSFCSCRRAIGRS